jgi:ABC-type multidrug transport system ATPase subunit
VVRSPQPDHSVELRALDAGYVPGQPVLRGTDLVLSGPGIVHVAGPNGSGKSTLVEVLSGYLRPAAGAALVSGMAASSAQAHLHRRICRTEPALYPMMSVRDHLIFASRWSGADPQDALDRAELYGLGEWLDHAAETLSTGNRRRLWIIQCTVGEFSTVVLDEPFNGLDQASEAVLVAELEAWAGTRCVVLVAHQPPPALRVDRVLAWPPGLDSGAS